MELFKRVTMFKKPLGNQKLDRRTSQRKRLKAMVRVVKEEVHTNEISMNHSLTGLFLKCNFSEKYQLKDQVRVAFKDENDVSHCRQRFI